MKNDEYWIPSLRAVGTVMWQKGLPHSLKAPTIGQESRRDSLIRKKFNKIPLAHSLKQNKYERDF